MTGDGMKYDDIVRTYCTELARRVKTYAKIESPFRVVVVAGVLLMRCLLCNLTARLRRTIVVV